MQIYVIQTGLFFKTIYFWHLVVPLNNFARMSNCPWVQVESSKPPPPEVYVWRWGRGIVFHNFTSIFSFINIHEYANEIILHMSIR